MHRLARVVVLVTACVATGTSTAFAQSRSPTPVIQMRYYPGGSSLKAWQLTISTDGVAKQQTSLFQSKGGTARVITKARRLSARELQRIRGVVNEAAFFTLSSQVSIFRFEHSGGLDVRFTEGGRSHEVTYHWPHGGSDPQILRRFTRVCRTILDIMPSPNGNRELKDLQSRGFPREPI